MYWQVLPLIGGPSWLPLHVRVVLTTCPNENNEEEENSNNKKQWKTGSIRDSYYYWWDFVPQNATQSSTLLQLVQGQSVPGLVRRNHSSKLWNNHHQALSSSSSSSFSGTFLEWLVQQANDFCQQAYSNENYKQENAIHSRGAHLHLVTNNCWTFAVQLTWHLVVVAAGAAATATADSSPPTE
ncbi:hypothetical protein ACA910_019314 [Epithemia clementina (nom. ined.)]